MKILLDCKTEEYNIFMIHRVKVLQVQLHVPVEPKLTMLKLEDFHELEGSLSLWV